MPISEKHPLILILGTRNRKKGEEMSELIAPRWEEHSILHKLSFQTLFDRPEAPEVDETESTFRGNARKKAVELALALNSWVLADDSGLAVDALGGAPGVYSARYAGTQGDDEANNQKLLSELAGVKDQDRGAAFVCVLALADPTGAVRTEVEGKCRGVIAQEPRGASGFGYDPLFLIREYHKTFGELSPLVKHQLSHRARAFERIRPELAKIFGP
jgi:XTP/dITP diphosphohydrolase